MWFTPPASGTWSDSGTYDGQEGLPIFPSGYENGKKTRACTFGDTNKYMSGSSCGVETIWWNKYTQTYYDQQEHIF